MLIIRITLILLLSSGTGYAMFSTVDSGTTTAQFLNMGAGARAYGMGQAFTGVSNDATAIRWNPAGIRQLKTTSFSLMHSVWLSDTTNDWLSIVLPGKDAGNFGLGVQYLSYGSIIKVDNTGLNIPGGEINPYDLDAIFSYAINLSESTKGFNVGINIKYLQSKIVNTAKTVIFDLGLMYDIKETLHLGLVVRNLGTQVKYIDKKISLPKEIKLGAGWNVTTNWLISVDIGDAADNGFNYGASGRI